MKDQIIVMPPGIIDSETRIQLHDKGYIVIETADPSKVVLLTPLSVIHPNDLLMAALTGANEDMSSREKFTKELIRRLLIAEEKKCNE